MQRILLCILASALGITPAAQATDIVARFVTVADSLFTQPDPMGNMWHQAPIVTVPLLPQTITTPWRLTTSVASVEVQAVHNGTWIAVLVRWADASRDESSTTGVFSDAVAVSFPLKDAATTSPFMGNPGAAVEVNYWKALWQRDIDHGYQDITDLHPRTTVDLYWATTASAPYPVREVLATPAARQWSPAIAQGNPMSQLHRRTPVEQLVAEGFGTLTTQKRQDAFGAGVYRDGKWSVVFARPLSTGDASDTVLQAGTSSAINFAVWDGGSGDRSGQKNYAMWSPLVMETTP